VRESVTRLRELRLHAERRRTMHDQQRRAEDLIREELHDARAKIIRGDGTGE
jgi:hypothetical protein